MTANFNYVLPVAYVAADVICVRTTEQSKSQLSNQTVDILLIKRANPPFKDKFAIPGGFVETDEDVIEGAVRELSEETNISVLPEHLKLLGIYGKPGRDPRGRTITAVYYYISDSKSTFDNVRAQDDAKEFKFFPIDNLPDLAFDHQTIIADLKNELIKQDLI
jgi:8-oxo-dGTP diphosphatase